MRQRAPSRYLTGIVRQSMNHQPSRPAELFLEFRDLRKRFGNKTALDGFTLQVHQGELLVLVGPSGCGKTTALRVLAGLERPDSGHVLLAGKPIERDDPAQRGVALVFQDFALYPQMSVRDNIEFGLQARRVPKPERETRLKKVSHALNLGAHLERHPSELSGGEQQRVAIARALARQPPVLLLDEPLANLDVQLRWHMRSTLAQLRSAFDTTIIYVTHDQAEAMALGDRIAVMRAGSVLQAATPAELYRRPANQFVASFFGVPPTNFLPGRLRSEGGSLLYEDRPGDPDSLRLIFPASLGGTSSHEPPCLTGDVVLGVRPEHLLIVPDSASATTGTCRALVVAVQFAGHEFHLTLERGTGTPLVLRLPVGRQLPTPGDTVTLRVDPTQALLFDQDGLAFGNASAPTDASK